MHSLLDDPWEYAAPTLSVDEVKQIMATQRGPLTIFNADNPPPSNPFAYDHIIKSWPAFFSLTIKGQKKADMRDKRDRDYKVGDRIQLREWDPFGSGYSGRWADILVTHIIGNESPCAMSSVGLDPNMVILSMELIDHSDRVAQIN